jgi:hypothetical protein
MSFLWLSHSWIRTHDGCTSLQIISKLPFPTFSPPTLRESYMYNFICCSFLWIILRLSQYQNYIPLNDKVMMNNDLNKIWIETNSNFIETLIGVFPEEWTRTSKNPGYDSNQSPSGFKPKVLSLRLPVQDTRCLPIIQTEVNDQLHVPAAVLSKKKPRY